MLSLHSFKNVRKNILSEVQKIFSKSDPNLFKNLIDCIFSPSTKNWLKKILPKKIFKIFKLFLTDFKLVLILNTPSKSGKHIAQINFVEFVTILNQKFYAELEYGQMKKIIFAHWVNDHA